jgi:hypothetical protein
VGLLELSFLEQAEPCVEVGAVVLRTALTA